MLLVSCSSEEEEPPASLDDIASDGICWVDEYTNVTEPPAVQVLTEDEELFDNTVDVLWEREISQAERDAQVTITAGDGRITIGARRGSRWEEAALEVLSAVGGLEYFSIVKCSSVELE